MKLFFEDARYDSGLTRSFKEVYEALKSSASVTENTIREMAKSVLSSDAAVNSFISAFNELLKGFVADNLDLRLVLKVASLGPDDNQNLALKYISVLTDAIWKKVNYVENVINQITTNAINPVDNRKQLHPYLSNEDLYNRSDIDFKYAVFAFDILSNENKIKNNFTTKKFGNKLGVLINLPEDEVKDLFGTDAFLDGNTFNPAANDTGLANNVQGYLEISPRFFYMSNSEEQDGKLIPSGVNSNSGKNMWHIMDIYSTDIEESVDMPEPKKSAKEDTDSAEDKARDLVDKINNPDFRLNKNTRHEIVSTIRDIAGIGTV